MCWASCRGWPTSRASSRSLYLPRRSQPRVRVPRSSVAIAMDMTTIYPFESPGGWHLIGRTPLWMFDQRREQPVFLAPGDSLSPSSASTAGPSTASRARGRRRHARLVEPGARGHERRPEGRARRACSTRVQDLGRIGFMALGMPTAGAMDRVALAARQCARRQSARHRGLEIGVMGPDLLVEADSVRVALVGPLLAGADRRAPDAAPKPLESDRTHLLKRGQILRVGMVEGRARPISRSPAASPCRPSWAACRLMPAPASAASTGRKLAAGDALPLVARAARRPATSASSAQPFDYGSGPIRVVWGPQDDYFTARPAADLRRVRTTASPRKPDRMGIRFEGPTIEHQVSKRRRRHHLRRHRPRAPSRCPGAGSADRAGWPTARP